MVCCVVGLMLSIGVNTALAIYCSLIPFCLFVFLSRGGCVVITLNIEGEGRDSFLFSIGAVGAFLQRPCRPE